jgi:hypothetical protein
MINNRGMARARAGAVVLACGTAALVALTGCSSSSSSSSVAGGSTTSAAPSPSNSEPAWAAALGPGVTVVAPGTAAPGNDSPGAVMTGFTDAMTSKKFSKLCSYALPSSKSQCQAVASEVAGNKSVAAQMPFAKNPGLGYVVIDGTKALVGTTGTYCAPGQSPKCFTNNDPAAIFSSGKSFASLWKTAVAEANASNSANTYTLAPALKIGGKWYADISLS